MTDDDALRRALAHLEAGEWQQAHAIVQPMASMHAYWLHGIVHLMEGDLGNARYWYGRAGRPVASDVTAELAAVRTSLQRS